MQFDATSGQQEGETRRRKLSPILDQIIYGSPSTTLNILGITRDLESGEPFFQIPSLNRVIVFKYPNFSIEVSDSAKTNFATAASKLSNDRPVETAIYIPNDEEFPKDGGYAVYLRQRDAETLLQRYVGIAQDNLTQSMQHDFRLLKLMDDIPSLDPFLLKTTFEREKISINPAYLAMNDGEEQKIKSVIGEKVRPIVSKALGGNDQSAAKTQRFVDAIWDPTIPEAALFIEAFKIDKKEVGNIFSAWKGVSFYQYQFERNKARIAEVLRWLKSEDSVPIDHREQRHFLEQQNMFKSSVQKKILNVLGNINQIFRDFDDCYNRFIGDGDPIAFRNFLVTSHYRYWLLGYCCTSLIHCRNIFDRALAEGARGKLRYENLNDMLGYLDATVSSQSQAGQEL